MFGDIELKVPTRVTLLRIMMSYSVSNSTAINRLRWIVFKVDFERNN